MKKVIRLVSKGLILGAIMLCSVMPVCAKEYTVTADINGPTTDSYTVDIETECHLHGYALCREGNMYGNHTTWIANLLGNLAPAATETYASFGSDSSLTNIMPKSPMVKPGPAVQSYEKTASMFTFYKKANTVLYY